MEDLTEEAAELVARVAALDIGKASLVACVRVPHESKPGRRRQEVRTFATTTRSLLELQDWLVCQGVTLCVMEATSSYWKPPFYLLEDAIECWVVNARDVKNVPGRPKTDLLTEHSGVPAGHSLGEPLPLMLLTCPGPYLRGHKGTEAGCATTGSGNTGLNHPPVFSSLLLVTPATTGLLAINTALDLLMRIVREER